MKEIIFHRMKSELATYRKYLVYGEFTSEQLVEQSYQFVIKQGLFQLFSNHYLSSLTCDELLWLNKQEHIINYLYGLWMNNDNGLAEEFLSIIHYELKRDMGVCKSE